MMMWHRQRNKQRQAEAGLSQAGRQALLCAMQIVAISAEAQLNCNEADKLPPPPEPRPPPTHTPAHTRLASLWLADSKS